MLELHCWAEAAAQQQCKSQQRTAPVKASAPLEAEAYRAGVCWTTRLGWMQLRTAGPAAHGAAAESAADAAAAALPAVPTAAHLPWHPPCHAMHALPHIFAPACTLPHYARLGFESNAGQGAFSIPIKAESGGVCTSSSKICRVYITEVQTGPQVNLRMEWRRACSWLAAAMAQPQAGRQDKLPAPPCTTRC